MPARRTPRQILLDGMAENRDFLPEVIRMVEQDHGGRAMHVNTVTLRNGTSITPTTKVWPDLTIYFPATRVFRMVELKAHGRKLSPEQEIEFRLIEQAHGFPIPIWEPRDLDDLIPETLAEWSGVPATGRLFTPIKRRTRK